MRLCFFPDTKAWLHYAAVNAFQLNSLVGFCLMIFRDWKSRDPGSCDFQSHIIFLIFFEMKNITSLEYFAGQLTITAKSTLVQRLGCAMLFLSFRLVVFAVLSDHVGNSKVASDGSPTNVPMQQA